MISFIVRLSVRRVLYEIAIKIYFRALFMNG
jgi:hypothetical protein